jgi:hypothetical protein
MKSLKGKLILLIFLTTTNFFGIVEFGQNNFDIAAIIGLVYILTTNLEFRIIRILDNKKVIFWTLFLVILNVVTSKFSYNQSLIFSLRSIRVWLVSLILLICISDYFIYSINKFGKILIFKFCFIVAFMSVFLNYYLYFSENIEFFKTIRITDRFNENRFFIAPISSIFLIFYFYNYSGKYKLLSKVLFFSLLSVILFISKTRAFIFSLIIIFIFIQLRYLFKRDVRIFIRTVFIFLTAYILLFDSINNQFQKYYDSLQISSGYSNSENILIRNQSLLFYWDKMQGVDYLIGRGVENRIFSGRKFEEKLTLADIGSFKIFYSHGIIGVILVFLFFKQMINNLKRESFINRSILHFIFFQLLISPTIIFIYSIEGLFINLLLFSYSTYERKNIGN